MILHEIAGELLNKFNFRFEYLWPFWLLCRSVFDSYKYKGLAFSFLFICIAITSDLLCLFFIPLSWIFFVASTFCWVQFVYWIHTEKGGICLPTILIWLLFVWMEAKVRWKDNQKMPHLGIQLSYLVKCIKCINKVLIFFRFV